MTCVDAPHATGLPSYAVVDAPHCVAFRPGVIDAPHAIGLRPYVLVDAPHAVGVRVWAPVFHQIYVLGETAVDESGVGGGPGDGSGGLPGDPPGSGSGS